MDIPGLSVDGQLLSAKCKATVSSMDGSGLSTAQLDISGPGRGESAKKARHNVRKELRKRVSVVSNDHSLPCSQASVPAFVN